VCLTAWLSRFNFRNTGCRDLNPASRRVRWAEAQGFQTQDKLLASRGGWPHLKGSHYARDHYPAVSGLQEPELFDDEEQEDDHGTVGVLQVLQHVPEAHGA
jgi:hypothetical protein